MYKFLAVLNGVFIAIMIVFNGILTDQTNLMLSLTIMNSISLITIIVIMLVKRVKLKSLEKIPIYLLFVGMISLLNIGLNSISFIHLGGALTMGLVLYGQLLASALVDHFGLLGMAQHRVQSKKIVGFVMMSMGILVMILY